VIFLTIGTHEPFDRLIRAVDDWCAAHGTGAQIFGQITDPKPGAYRPQYFDWVARLSPQEYNRRFAAAGLIVSHAEIGSACGACAAARAPSITGPRCVSSSAT